MANEIIKTTDNGMQIAGINMDSFDGALKVTKALNVAASLDKTVEDGQAFEFIGCIFKDGINEQTNEPCKESYFIQRDGSALFTKSGGIYQSAQNILGLMGQWLSSGIWVRIASQPTGRGNTIKLLEPIAPPVPAE